MPVERSTRVLSSPGDSSPEREALRRGLRRANIASVLILLLLVALAFGFVWNARQSAQEAERANTQAARANAEAERARQATLRAEDELWNSRLNELRARRVAGGPGARLEAEALLRELVQRPNLSEAQVLALRQEAVARLALVDVTLTTNWIARAATEYAILDGALKHYVRHNAAREVELREQPSGRLVASFRGASNAVPHASVLTPDGQYIATRFHGSDVLIWHVASRKLLLKTRCQRLPQDNRPLMPLPDNRALAMFTVNGLVIQRLETDATARLLQRGRVVANTVFTRDARRLAVQLRDKESVVEIWDAETGATLERFDVGFRIWTMEWHPDGRRLALSGDQGRLGTWDTASVRSNATIQATNTPRELLRFDGHTGGVDYTGFSPDGQYLLTHAYDKTSIVWDAITGRRLLTETRVQLEGPYASDSNLVGLAHQDLRHSVCTFLPRTGFQSIASIGDPRPVNGIWFSPDARLLVIAHPARPSDRRGECRVWDLARGLEIARFPGIWAQFSADGRALFVFEVDALRRYQLPASFDSMRDWPPGDVLLTADPGDSINAGTLSTDGRTLAIGTVNKALLMDAATGTVLRRFTARTHDTELSPDGALLATRYHNQLGALRNATNGTVLTQMQAVVEFIFSPDNQWILARGVDKLRLLDRSLAVVREIPIEVGAGFPPSTDFSPDGSMLAVMHNRFDVRLFDVPGGRELATLVPPHPAQGVWGRGLAFSKDGQRIALAKENGEVVAWDLPVVRAELAKLNLDWATEAGSETTRKNPVNPAQMAQALLPPGNSPRADGAFATNHPALTTAFGAVALALAAGLFISLHQRRMLSAYARSEALGAEQQRKLQAAQEELQHGQKMRALGTLAAGIAHDFNNLLSVIRLSNQLAAEQTKASGTAKENMDAIESAVAQGETIVHSMLGYSRAAADADHDYSVSAAVSETVAMLGRKFLAGIVLQLEVEPDIPNVQGVRGRLEQMLLNLVVNASEAMNGTGTLRLTARIVDNADQCVLKPVPARRYVAVSVGDSGPGIPAETLARIFEPFFTTKHSGARPGTGLGLSTVYTMAQQDGLGLAVETTPRSGTTFRILIPIPEGERNKPTANPGRAS